MRTHGIGYADRKGGFLTALPMIYFSGLLQEITMKCLCGCGKEVKEGNRFIHGHQSKGKVVTPEHRRKISESKKNRIIFINENVLCDCGCGQFVTRNKKYPFDWNRFVYGHNKGNLGNNHSKESRSKMSKSQTGRPSWNKGLDMNALGYTVWNKGKRCSEDHIKRNSEVHMGQKAWNKGLDMNALGHVIWNKGIPCAEKTKQKLSKKLKGKPSLNKGRPMPFSVWVSKIKPRSDGYCDIWGDKEYKDDLKASACEHCGMTNMMSIKLFGVRLSSHHFNGKKNCAPWDIQTLCNVCHAKADWVLRRNNFNNENISRRTP